MAVATLFLSCHTFIFVFRVVSFIPIEGVYTMENNKQVTQEEYESRNIIEHTGQNLFLLIITALLLANLYFSYKAYDNSNKNWGSLEHYDSLYSERQGHIGMNGMGEIDAYTTPNGETYYLHEPVPADEFYHPN